MIIHSVQEYLEFIELLSKKYTYIIPRQHILKPEQVYPAKLIYRGHSDHENYKLLPGIFRWKQADNGNIISEFSQMEYSVLYDFISEACGVVKDLHSSEVVPWLEIAQHYGVPTRLLDFSTNPLVALYFACISSPDKDASVWIVNEAAYKRVFYNTYLETTPVLSDGTVTKIVVDEISNQDCQLHDDPNVFYQFPWIYKPFYRNDRMRSQSSIFMLWAAQRTDLTSFMMPDYYMVEDPAIANQATGIICSVIVPHEKKRALLKQLDICGINEKFIYPGLDGIGRYIREKYSYKKK